MQFPLFPENSKEIPSVSPREPLVLLLGNVDHEGVTSALKLGGGQYKKKVLNSRPENWESIIEIFNEFTVRAVIVKLNAHVYDLIAHPGYTDVAARLFARVSTSRHAVFVFEDLLSGQASNHKKRSSYIRQKMDFDDSDLEDLDFYGRHFGMYQPAVNVLTNANEMLASHRLNLIPYKTNAEITVAATQVLKEYLEGLLFRLYVPANRLWATEVDRLLQLFRDYLLKTGRKGIRLDQIRTDHGISYEFHGDDAPAASSLSDDFQDFSRFMDLCVSNPKEAEVLLQQKTVDPREIAGILTRYSKEAKRLQVDLKQDRERKLLSIRHRLESDLADALPDSADWQMIDRLVASTIPEAFNIAGITLLNRGLHTPSNSAEHTQLTINLNPQIINKVNGVVAREILGDVSTSAESEALLDLIRKHADSRSLELIDAAQTLSDRAMPRAKRLTSAQKLKGFVFSLGEKLGPVARDLATAYIEKKLGLK
jgi:hypothetical protein